jgi:hypothetical protein
MATWCDDLLNALEHTSAFDEDTIRHANAGAHHDGHIGKWNAYSAEGIQASLLGH